MIAADSKSALHDRVHNISAHEARVAPENPTRSPAKGIRYVSIRERQWQDGGFNRVSANTPLPVSTGARSSGPGENDVALSQMPGTPDFVELSSRRSSQPNAECALASSSTSVDSGQHHGACNPQMYSVQDGRALSPATRALLSMLQGSRMTGSENTSHPCMPDDRSHSITPESAGRSPLRPCLHSTPAASLPPPPSPTSKAEQSMLSPGDIPLQLVAHPVSDAEESQGTPLMICNFLQLTLNEPPSSTKVAAETDFMALAKQKLFVSEMPTPPTQAGSTPGHSLVPGVSLHARTGRLDQATIPSVCHSSIFPRASPLEQSAEQALQKCGGLASPQPCHSSVDQLTLVDAATSPGTPLGARSSNGVSAADSSKAASEQAAVELCHSPISGPAGSPWTTTPTCLRGKSATIDGQRTMEFQVAEGIELTPVDSARCHGQAASPGLSSLPEPAAPVGEAAGTPRLQAMGNALSPLLRDACGRSAKSVLRDLLADLVEQERMLDAQASVVKTCNVPSPERTTAGSAETSRFNERFCEETVTVVAGSPLHPDSSAHAESGRAEFDHVSCGSGMNAVDPHTFDAVYDEAVQLHLAAGLENARAQGSHAHSLTSKEDMFAGIPGGCSDVFEAAQAAPKVGHGVLPDQDQPVSPAMTRVSTFSVRSALSSDVSHSQRLTGSTADVAAWLCPTEPLSQSSNGARTMQGRPKAGSLHARQTARPSTTVPIRSLGAGSSMRTAATCTGKRSQKQTKRFAAKEVLETQAHAAPAWRPACGPAKGAGKAPFRGAPAQSYAAKAATAAAAPKRPMYDSYEYFERTLGPPKAYVPKSMNGTSGGQYASSSCKSKASSKSKVHSTGKAKASKGGKRVSKQRRAVSGNPSSLLQAAQFEQPADTIALAARMGYDMEFTHPCSDACTPSYRAAMPYSPLKPALNPAIRDAGHDNFLFSHSGIGMSPCATRPLGTRDVNAAPQPDSLYPAVGKACSSLPEQGISSPSRQVNMPVEKPNSFDSTRMRHQSRVRPEQGAEFDTSAALDSMCSGGFTFSASQPETSAKQPGKTLANLPDYGAKRRKQSREGVPHDSLLFVGFSPWLEVSFFTLKDVTGKIPQVPGIYEWGAMPPGTHTHSDILAFYLGKAGTHAGKGSQNLATRFSSYTKLAHGNILVGPWRPGRESVKTQLFQVLQQRGFRMFYRYRVCLEPEEPEDVEEQLLLHIDYPGNERTNKGYRQLILPDGQSLSALPKGQYL